MTDAIDYKEMISPKNPSSLKRLAGYFKPYRLMLLGVFIALSITSASILMISQAIRMFIDLGIAKQDIHELDEALIFLGITIVVLALFTFCRFFLITLVGERVITDLRRDIFKHILILSPDYFEKNKSGELLSRLTADTTLLLTLIGSSFSFTIRNLIMLLGGIVVLVGTSSKLSLMLLFIIPAVISPLFFLGKKLRVYSRNSQDRVAEISARAEQSMNALKIVQAYRREEYEMSKFNYLLNEQLRTAFNRILLRGLLTAIIIALAFGGVGFVLWMGAHKVVEGSISPGELSAFVYVAVVCAGAVAALSDVLGDWQKAVGATERIFEFLSSKPSTKHSDAPITFSGEFKEKIEFKDVSFSYDKLKKRKILNNINLEIIPGQMTALVGKSGAGKTTIFMLLERFYNLDSGKILFDGKSIDSINMSDLRAMFTYVPQEPYVFATSVYENIAYGNPSASREKVINAAEQAGCMEFIEKLPEGIDTYLGDKGMKLSGGQKQRLAIARAILNDPKILLLDEATSSLDSENEDLVQKALNNLMRGRTTIVIAHRLSTVKNADQIIVLENGAVIQRGTHEELIKQKTSTYARLAKLQFG
ncbi:MAG: transporter, ATP-binding protein [Candidatus Midichloriaceae bacterium]|jgi:ATP-binding cassette subfamily B protein|nr:transporter, ATP-binding protein [Candidatus Midichloriaceae bacterium]